MTPLKFSRILPLKVRQSLPGFTCPSRQTFLITGASKQSQLPLKIALMTHKKCSAIWMQDTFFTKGAKIKDVGHQCIEDYIRPSHEFDMLIMRKTGHICDYYSHLPQLETSCWIHLGIDLKEISELCRRSPRGMAQAAKLIRRYGMDYEITSNEEYFRNSVNTIIYPYLKWRHQGTCIFDNESVFEHMETTEVLSIIANGEQVACCTFTRLNESKTIQLNKLGIRMKDGKCPYLNMGAIPAIYYYAAKHFYEEGYTYLDIGGSRPMLQDPITSFKLRLGASISQRGRIHKEGRMSLYVKNNSDGLRDTLVGRDLFTNHGENLTLTRFCDNTREATPKFQSQQQWYPNKYNIDAIHLYNFDGASKHSSDFNDLMLKK